MIGMTSRQVRAHHRGVLASYGATEFDAAVEARHGVDAMRDVRAARQRGDALDALADITISPDVRDGLAVLDDSARRDERIRRATQALDVDEEDEVL